MDSVLTLDIGGTKLSAAIFEGMRLSGRETVETQAGEGVQATLERIAELLQKVLRSQGVDRAPALGVACPGPLSIEQGLVLHAPLLGWRDVPLVSWLENRLNCPVLLENDANAAAYGEFKMGAGAGVKDMAYITVSTGVGCGLIANGQIVHGFHDAAGEIGHLNIVPEDNFCACGRKGCLETYASGTALQALYQKDYHRALSAKEIARNARDGDEACRTLLARMGEALGRAIAALQQIMDPQCVVLGGSVSDALDLFGPSMIKAVQAGSYWGDHPEKWLRKANLHPDSGLFGAGLLAIEKYGN